MPAQVSRQYWLVGLCTKLNIRCAGHIPHLADQRIMRKHRDGLADMLAESPHGSLNSFFLNIVQRHPKAGASWIVGVQTVPTPWHQAQLREQYPVVTLAGLFEGPVQ